MGEHVRTAAFEALWPGWGGARAGTARLRQPCRPRPRGLGQMAASADGERGRQMVAESRVHRAASCRPEPGLPPSTLHGGIHKPKHISGTSAARTCLRGERRQRNGSPLIRRGVGCMSRSVVWLRDSWPDNGPGCCGSSRAGPRPESLTLTRPRLIISAPATAQLMGGAVLEREARIHAHDRQEAGKLSYSGWDCLIVWLSAGADQRLRLPAALMANTATKQLHPKSHLSTPGSAPTRPARASPAPARTA